MDGLQWYPRFTGDYARKTQGLSLLEHGAYNLLLDHYYATGVPLPASKQCSSNAKSNAGSTGQLLPDHERVYRICRAISKAEQEAVDNVLAGYFTLTDEGYINKKASQVIEEQKEKHERRVNAGRKGGNKKAEKQSSKASSKASSNALAKPKQPEPEPEYIKNNIKKDFDLFWKEYPRREAREKAFKQFEAVYDDIGSIDDLILKTRQFSVMISNTEDKFKPYASTWLKEKRFNDIELEEIKPVEPMDTSNMEDWQLQLLERYGEVVYRSWFSKTIFENGELVFNTRFVYDWVNTHFADKLPKIFKGIRLELE